MNPIASAMYIVLTALLSTYEYKILSRGGRLKELLSALNTVSCVESSKLFL